MAIFFIRVYLIDDTDESLQPLEGGNLCVVLEHFVGASTIGELGMSTMT